MKYKFDIFSPVTSVLVTDTGAIPPKARYPRLGSYEELSSAATDPRLRATEMTITQNVRKKEKPKFIEKQGAYEAQRLHPP
jgi:hypothetical protein